MVKKKADKRVTRHTTAWILRKTLKKIKQVQKESEYVLSQDIIIGKAVDELLKHDPKAIKWD